MKFLFYRYNNICEPDIIEAFETLSYQIDTIELEMENKNPGGKLIIDTVSEKLYEGGYDAVFSVNFYPILSKICSVFKIRYISWTTDCPVDELYTEDIKNIYNRTFCFDYQQYEKAHELSPGTVFYMPLGTNVGRWDRVIGQAKPDESARFASDIAFVGSLYTEKSGQDWFAESARTRLEAVTAIADVLQSADWGSDYAKNQAAPIFAVYTGSDTKELRVDNRGMVRTHTQMPLVFSQSKINLNITCDSIKSGLPQRIWDIMGCGGFVLTNAQPEIGEYFEIGRELVVYNDAEDLKDKIEYYLKHDSERCEIARRGYEKVKAEHTIVQRLADILYIAFAV